LTWSPRANKLPRAIAYSSALYKLDIPPATSLRSISTRCCLKTLNPRSRRQAIADKDSLAADCVADLDAFAEVSFCTRHVKRGEAAFHIGDSFSAIYAVLNGFFKITNVHEMGHEQVLGFFMRGELFGLDGLGSGGYNCTALALEDSDIVVLPFAQLQELARANQAMQHQLSQVLAREITRDHGMMLLLGSMSAEARLASFLLNLSARFVRRGYSPSDFILRMTREDIGSYIGLQLETVSRLFSQFKKRGILQVNQKHVCILDPQGLQQMLSVPS
jgi:CRP/FNR family transcriptional regulator